MDEQIREIRLRKHQEYQEYQNYLELNDQDNIHQIDKQNNYQTNYQTDNIIESTDKYDYQLDNPIVNIPAKVDQQKIYDNRHHQAANLIQKFIKKKLFYPECINESEISDIPPIYRIRINITELHINEYNETDIPENLLAYHRIIYNMVNYKSNVQILFRYCFDIRKLILDKNQVIGIYDNYYFLQPNDHIYLNKIWRKICGTTSESIIYMTNFEYYKSLSVDMYK